METQLKVTGMHCKSCEMLLVDSISEIAGVEQVNANSKIGIVTVKYDNEEALNKVKKTIEKEGHRII